MPASYYVRRPDGRAYSLYGWTTDVHAALHYSSEKDAAGALGEMLGISGCSVEKVPPKIAPGNTPLTKPIFSGGVSNG